MNSSGILQKNKKACAFPRTQTKFVSTVSYINFYFIFHFKKAISLKLFHKKLSQFFQNEEDITVSNSKLEESCFNFVVLQREIRLIFSIYYIQICSCIICLCLYQYFFHRYICVCLLRIFVCSPSTIFQLLRFHQFIWSITCCRDNKSLQKQQQFLISLKKLQPQKHTPKMLKVILM